MTRKGLTDTLRRDATYVGNAVASFVCAGFLSVAMASAVIDLVP